MLSVDEALKLIGDSVSPMAPESVRLNASLGLVLAADAISGMDSPPFDKALMDGFAVRSSDCTERGAALAVTEEVTAGRVAERVVQSGEAIAIMTGAPLPQGADAVIPVEKVRREGDRIELQETVAAEACILRRGASMQRGECVLPAGRRIRPQEAGLLAELGCHTVMARPRPSVAILATGDELVPVNEAPGPGQIRNSNESMLAAQIENAGGMPVPLGIARDDPAHLKLGISLGLEADVMVLAGGVSAGKLDLVPAELHNAGVEQVFHKVRVKPGKPLWFGMGEHRGRPVPVFGLPGNPVSSMVCFELFVRAALDVMSGLTEPRLPSRLPLRSEAVPNRDRPTYHPARLERTDAGTCVVLVDWVGSADLRCTVLAEGVALLPAGETPMSAGTVVDFLPW